MCRLRGIFWVLHLDFNAGCLPMEHWVPEGWLQALFIIRGGIALGSGHDVGATATSSLTAFCRLTSPAFSQLACTTFQSELSN